MDFEKNLDLIATNFKYNAIASLWLFCIEKSNPNNKFNALRDAENDKVERVSIVVNGGRNALANRKDEDALKNVKIHLCF